MTSLLADENANQAQRPWGRWRETFWLLTNCELPASLTIGDCHFSGNHFYCEHKQLFANDLELEQFDKTAQATLWVRAKSVVDALNFSTPDHIHFEGLRHLGGERELYRLDGSASHRRIQSVQRTTDLRLEYIPSSEFIEKIANYRKHLGLGLMIEAYVAAKSLSSVPRESLLLALKVLQIACWQEARKATPESIEDKEVMVSPSILKSLWTDLKMDQRLPDLIQQVSIMAHAKIGSFQPGDSVLLHALEVCVSERNVGFGAATDPLSELRLPVDEALGTAREFILAYGERLESQGLVQVGPNVSSVIIWWSLRFQDKERPSDDTGSAVSERGATQSWEMQGPTKMMRRVWTH